MTVMLPEKKKS